MNGEQDPRNVRQQHPDPTESLLLEAPNGTDPMSDAPRRSTRREFLQGQSAADAMEDLGRSALPEPAGGKTTDPSTGENPQSYLLQISREAMACRFAVFLNASEHRAATERAVEALDLVEHLEEQLSVYRHRSEISRLNATAANAPVRVESRLFRLLQRALELHAATNGAFDITSGPLIKAWGFYRREGRLPNETELEEALQHVGSQWLDLDPARETVSYRYPGVEINLGAIGKGYALDRCDELLREAEVEDFMIHGGHSTILRAASDCAAKRPAAGVWVSAIHSGPTADSGNST